MPIKQVTCSICGNTVNKAVTYEIEKGKRACRSHDGVTAKRDAAEAARAAKLTAPPPAPPKPIWSEIPPSGIPDPICWVCMNKGLRRQDFFAKVLVEMEKNRLVYKNNVDLFSEKGLFPKIPERCIFVITKEMAEPAMKYVREEFQTMVGMGGVIAICGPCCGTFKIEALPKVGMEELKQGMVLAEILKPAVHQQAVQELTRDN